MIKINSENQLLDAETRKKLIKSFNEGQAARRKYESFKAYECLKDHTDNYVLRNLLNQFDYSTVQEMQYSISNISILRKVIDKLAKVYANGVKRTIGDSEDTTDEMEKAAKVLKVNEAMKKANRYFRTFKNTLVYVRPQKENDEKYNIKIELKAPFNYDVIEHPEDPTRALAVVLSDYIPTRQTLYYLGDVARAGREGNTRVAVNAEEIGTLSQGYTPGGQVQKSGEKDTREFIWWTENYHFTTNVNGELIDGQEDGMNPIAELPFVNLCGEQDTGFWADGGKDLVDAGVKINTMVTNADHIGVSQGFGQLYMTGKNLPKSVKVGPNNCVQLEQAEGEPTPQIGYLNSNPPLTSLKEQIEMSVALMLSTNNLSTSGFSTSLAQGKDFASGIALMIDKSESIEDINEQAQIFIDKEPEVWEKIGHWFEYFRSKSLLVEKLAVLQLPVKDLAKIQLTFPAPMPVQSESEELDNLKKRKELGLNTEAELIMRDNPGMTEQEAEKKLAKIKEEKLANAAEFGIPGAGDNANGDQNQSGNRVQNQNGVGPGPEPKPQASGNGQNQNQK